MNSRAAHFIRSRWVAALALAAGAVGGCANVPAAPPPASTQAVKREPPRQTDPEKIQAVIISFADRYMAAMADAYDRAQQHAATPQAQLSILRCKISACNAAIGNAANPSPLVGLMDMAVLVTLNRRVTEQPWARELFGPEDHAMVLATMAAQEKDIWNAAAVSLTPQQIGELHELAGRWLAEHPGQRYVLGARLTDFPQGRKSGGAGGSGPFKFANSVFALATLNPFQGLDPTVQQIEESRILAERMFHYARAAPVLLTWQVDAACYQVLAQPQMTRLLEDTTGVAASTTRVAAATTQVAAATTQVGDASNRFAETVEQFRLQLPKQQAALVDQADQLIARQREAALNQATTQVSVERRATIDQLSTTMGGQQDLLARKLQGVTEGSIDRLYWRARSLVLIAVGSIFAAFVIYRLISTRLVTRAGPAARGMTRTARDSMARSVER
jgi:hypothetical protein